MFALMVLGVDTLIFDIAYISVWYLCLLAIVLQDITNVEVDKRTIIVHRYLFKPMVIEKEDINTIKGRDNIPRKYYIFINAFMLAGLALNFYFAYNGIQRDLLRNISMEETIFSVLSHSIIVFFWSIFFFNAEKRFRYPGFLEIRTSKDKFRFYTHKPAELRDLLM
ncbi:hypothetical protein [Methanolobus profundi]|uniref:Uncharacterized protein n=1 Tax=Methanolobus profundi TaxID=487685 RepID=A0A1I4RED1_9EURY|nr:hypothetical protein [Methanolobus profundi]SFM50621.1 hypothetical protein SAMN04488696_1528 [Methanolobus profundi]